ncbi:Ser/Thr protein phosphatase family protein [Aphelenchoides avenae]|nr:Ser/Thr protein phosphatase family protein [Aphelenchus avenae]
MFYLLRGNHEAAPVNREYGLYDELIERFADQAPRLWNALNDLFAYMPLAALVGGRILCMHGGLSRHLNSLDDILQACDLLWADPSPVPSFQGFGPNTERSVSCYFGEDVVAQTCERLKVDIIVRAHQVQLDGCSFFCRRRLITIFSAPMYCKEINNMGAIMQVTRDLAGAKSSSKDIVAPKMSLCPAHSKRLLLVLQPFVGTTSRHLRQKSNENRHDLTPEPICVSKFKYQQ